MNFWQRLPKPFFVLAPMDDVTDSVFRQVVARAAAPDVFLTEFVSVNGLQSAGRKANLSRLTIEPGLTRPLVAQIWGKEPDLYERSARDIADMGFSGIDINLGCPERSVVARGCGGGLIGQNELVTDIIAATKAGAPNLPVSVKTRLGLGQVITEDWTGFLLGLDLAGLAVHGRTVREMSRVPARWDEIAKVVRLRDQIAPKTVIIGNGDVRDRSHGLDLAAAHGVDGIMIGRGIFTDIFAFEEASRPHDREELLEILLHHLDLYEQSPAKPLATLKKFFKLYVNGWPGASDLRAKLMQTQTPAQVREVLANVYTQPLAPKLTKSV